MKLLQAFSSFRFALPFIFGLLLVSVGIVPFSIVSFYRVQIPFVLVFIFYFAVFRPRLLNGALVFLLGVYADLITQSPLGVQPFIYVLLFFVANLNHRILSGLSFNQLWGAFLFIAGVLHAAWYGLFSLLSLSLIAPFFMVIQYLFLGLSYPLLMGFAAWLDRRIGRPA